MRIHGHREGNIIYWGLLGSWRARGGTVGGRELGRYNIGEMPDIGDGYGSSKPRCHICTYAAILHVLHMYPRISAIKYTHKKI